MESGKSMGGCNFGNILSINLLKCQGGKVHIFDKTSSNSSELYHLEHGLYRSFTDTVQAMNTLIQEKHNHSAICVTVTLSRRM